MLKKQFVQKNATNTPSGIDVTLEELIALRRYVVHNPPSSKKNLAELFSGHSIAKIRGRGIEFDATREYQPGDDIRRMAWRVTARSLKPHVKVYHEEKERPVWLGVDLSPSLYFGTRCMFKSVCSIKRAAFLGWSYLHKRERIGACIATPAKTMIYTPQGREREFLSFLKSLADYSKVPPAFTEKNCLEQLLVALEQQVRSGHWVFILSDFADFGRPQQKLIAHLSERAQVKLIFTYDHFEEEPPPPYRYVMTDGQKTAFFNTARAPAREHYREQFQSKCAELITFTRKNGMALQLLRTDQEQEVTAQP